MFARRSSISSRTIQIFTHQQFRVFHRIFLLILCLSDWRTTLAQQHLPSAIVPDSQQTTPQLGKNHLQGIRRLSSAASQENAWEHRHLRHIPSPMEPIKRPPPPPLSNQQMMINGGGEPRPPTAQRVPVPLKEAPSPVLEEVDERMVMSLTSVEAKNLAQKLLQNAGMDERELAPREEEQEQKQQHEMMSPHQKANRKKGSSSLAAAVERKNYHHKLTRPPLFSSPISAHSTAADEEGGDIDSSFGGERKRMERMQSRWRKIGPLHKTNSTSSLLPLRRLRLVQHRRKFLQKDSRQRLQQQMASSSLPTPVPQHAATVERAATNLAQQLTTIISIEMTTTTTESPLVPSSSSTQSKASAGGAPRARQMAATAAAANSPNKNKRHRIAAARVREQKEVNKEKNNDDNFDFKSARRALIEAAQKHQQQQQQNPTRGWQSAERMLRHRHRIRYEQQQRQRQRRPPIFNGPLLSGANSEEENGGGQHRQRQFGLKTEWREGQRGNRLEELLGEENDEQQMTKPAAESTTSSMAQSHNNRRPAAVVQEERRFRLVPNKVVFRPRLKIRRPPAAGGGHPSELNGDGGGALALGIGQQRSGQQQQPIALPSLSTFESSAASDSGGAQPVVPVPPAPEEPPLHVAPPPPPPQPSPIEEPPAATAPPPPPPISPPQPWPALEVGSIGEQPPQNIQGGMPTMPSPETTTVTTQVLETKQAAPLAENTAAGSGGGGSDIVLDKQEAAGSGLLSGGVLPETGPLPPGFADGSGFIGGGGGGDNGLVFGAELGTPPPGFKEAFGLNGFETSIGLFGAETTTTTTAAVSTSTSQTTSSSPAVVSTTTPTQTTTTISTTTAAPATTTTLAATTTPPPPPPPSPPIEEMFIIPENSGLRPVSPPKEFQVGGGFGSHGSVVGSSRGGGSGGFGGGGSRILEPPPPNAQVEPPQQPLKPEDFFTGESAFTPNKRGPEGDGYGPLVLPGAPIPPAPAGPAIGVGGAAAGIHPLSPIRPLPNAIGGAAVAPPEPPVENEATTVKPSALLNFLNKADEGFNQVITHFERGTPLEAAAIDIMEVALGSQKLDSQAKLLSHVDRAIGLDNLQRLQRWANTGGAFDLIKEQFAKIAKNYKPPPETANLFTVPPQLEYLFQPGSSSSGKKRRRKRCQ